VADAPQPEGATEPTCPSGTPTPGSPQAPTNFTGFPASAHHPPDKRGHSSVLQAMGRFLKEKRKKKERKRS